MKDLHNQQDPYVQEGVLRKEKKNTKISRGQKGFKKHQEANNLLEGLNSLAG